MHISRNFNFLKTACFPLGNSSVEIPEIFKVGTFPRDKSLNSVTFYVHGP